LFAVTSGTRVLEDGGVAQGDLEIAPPAGAPDSWTTAAMVRLLYRRCYLGRSHDDLDTEIVHGRSAFVPVGWTLIEALRAADGGRWIWEPGWTRYSSLPDGGAILENEHGMTIRVRADEFRTNRGPDPSPSGARPTGAQSAGAPSVEVRLPTARPHASPGYFLVSGTAGLAVGPDIVRWSLDVSAEAAPDVLATIVSRLDGVGIRFTVKVLNDPVAYPNPDAAVLSASRADLAAVHPVVLDLHAADPTRFRPAVPLFSLKVANGIGVAEEPPRATVPLSFGQHRCRLVAKGIVDAGPSAGPAARYRAVASTFAEAGVSIDAPHLNPGSSDLEFPGKGGEPQAA
jgi:hypothetical protein